MFSSGKEKTVTKRVLFLCKQRESYGSNGLNNSGLYNSVNFVSEMLSHCGIESKVVDVVDANDIDREVYQYRPTHVSIEAIWVMPEKFGELNRLHPKVNWVIRVHSNLPFLANEGIALAKLLQYLDYRKVSIAANAWQARDDLRELTGMIHGDAVSQRVLYLPNYYDLTEIAGESGKRPDGWLDVGCFGAIRPLKNHLVQAVAAIRFAEEKGLPLRFHINAGRVEQNGGQVLNSLRSLFQELPSYYQLVEHPWHSYKSFLNLVRTMDLGLQVSLTETFNIVSADFTRCNVPIVVSDSVFWACPKFFADPLSSNDITKKMHLALKSGAGHNRSRLARYCRESELEWLNYLQDN